MPTGTTSRPLSVLHVVAPAPIGGLESVVTMLVREQRRRGHEVRVLAVLDEGATGHPLCDAVADAGAIAVPVAIPGRAYARERGAVAALCRAHAVDVVHTHGFRPDVVDSGVARRCGAATVSTVHGFIGGSWRGRLYERLQEWSYRRCDAVVAVSRTIVARLAAHGVPAERVHLLRNAFAPAAAPLGREAARERLALPPDAFVVGWVGRLSWEKGADVALAALAELPGAVLCVVGDGRERAALEAQARALGIADRVRWAGIVHDAAAHMRAFDAYLLSSRTEGTPMALLEAMAAGVPVVATRVGGVPDVIADGESGLLVAPEAPTALAEALLAVRTAPHAAARRAADARATLDREFDPAAWGDRHDAVYAAACERAAARARRPLSAAAPSPSPA
jgi:glycosyltransferase involved in cell wall biosynthesis